MIATNIFLVLCAVGVPFLIYAFISFSRDERRPCRRTCRLERVKETLVLIDTVEEYESVVAGDDDDAVAVAIR